MALLVSWLHCREEARQALFQSPNFSVWLQRLVLEDPEPAVRREVCSALYKLCLGMSVQGDVFDNTFVAPMLSQLLLYMEKAEGMRPQKLEVRILAVMLENTLYNFITGYSTTRGRKRTVRSCLSRLFLASVAIS